VKPICIGSGILAAVLAVGILSAGPIYAASNPMGYTLISASDAASLPRNGGSLGMEIERAEQISSDGMIFDLVRIKSVRRGGAAASAGLEAGDEIVAVDGHLFATLQAFAAYIGSVHPGRQVMIDLIPPGGGPQQAQRVTVAVGAASRSGQVPETASARNPGMSTGTKVAIGLGLLFGCYELGCFSHHATLPPAQ
jgi:membrane-associated protease RseP (regulator of RpoE activity)